MRAGDTVVTPAGVGKVFAVEGDRVVVEMEWSYLVEFTASQVREYTVQGW